VLTTYVKKVARGIDGVGALVNVGVYRGPPEYSRETERGANRLTTCSMSGPVSERGEPIDKNHSAAVDKMLTIAP
jgi:hypothetical protein